MTRQPGEVFLSHSAWRIARPDCAYDRLVLPARCDGDLIVERIVGDRLELGCDRCQFTVSTSEARAGTDPDARTQSQSVEQPF